MSDTKAVTTISITARDPLVVRDGRPFGAGQGNRMRGLSWPLPSMASGSLRSAIVKATGSLDFSSATPVDLLNLSIAGPLPVVGDKNDAFLCLPAPADLVYDAKDPNNTSIWPVRPIETETTGGTDIPNGLRPCGLPGDAGECKPTEPPAWWPIDNYCDWLLDRPVAFDDSYFGHPVTQLRDQVKIKYESGTAEDARLFTSVGLSMSHLTRFGSNENSPQVPIRLTMQVSDSVGSFDHAPQLNALHPFGGERRLVYWSATEGKSLESIWDCPKQISKALNGLKSGNGLRMVLATPAIFSQGWRPSWLIEEDGKLTGKPFESSPKMELVSACVPRWKAISGWSYGPHAEDAGRKAIIPDKGRGPKAIRRMVPAGAVYFFRLTEDCSPEFADAAWLKPVSDANHDCRDGFGLATWGTWKAPQPQA